MIRSREKFGLKKYNTSIDREDLSIEQWCQHAIEEMLDGVQYMQRVKDKTKLKECYQCNEMVTDLNERSRCVTCLTNSLKFNLKENEALRGCITVSAQGKAIVDIIGTDTIKNATSKTGFGANTIGTWKTEKNQATLGNFIALVNAYGYEMILRESDV